RKKIGPLRRGISLTATQGQLAFERQHLLRKLRVRDRKLYRLRRRVGAFEPHPLFRIVSGCVEAWESKAAVKPNDRWRGRERRVVTRRRRGKTVCARGA